ncbi:MAG: HAMP domain-containing sensor histidine kinase [Rhizomicrobium sp.]|jgi:signal transduction histidine kinase
MAGAKATSGLLDAATIAMPRRFGGFLGHVRVIVIGSLVLISGSFACAALIQMRLDREHAVSQAAAFEQQRARTLSTEIVSLLGRYQAIGRGFGDTELDAESSAALAEAGGRGLRNVAVLDATGHLVSELKSAPHEFLPLSEAALEAARSSSFIGPAADGRHIVLASSSDGRIVAIEIDPDALIASMPDGLLATQSGRLLASGQEWKSAPDTSALALSGTASATRIVESAAGGRLVSLANIPGWPLVAGASADVGQTLGDWYGTLPLYLFLILGPALAGAGLAAVFVREFERRVRTAEAVRQLRSTRPEDARLLVRLADAERRAIHAERAKGEFMSHMSHELRTPLNAIIGFAEIIEQSGSLTAENPRHLEYARDIARAGQQLHSRLSEILEFVDLDARRTPLVQEAVDVSVIARESLQAFQTPARERGIKLLVSLRADLVARADPTAVRRIFASLFGNAVQFTPDGGEVRVAIRREKDIVLAVVKDTGTGFTDDEKARAGEAFRRFDRPGHETGVGLGLAIATTLARRMGGSLRITGAHGHGTTVELRLPAAPE